MPPESDSDQEKSLQAAIDFIEEVECPPGQGETSLSEKLQDLLDQGKICIETVPDANANNEGTTLRDAPDGSGDPDYSWGPGPSGQTGYAENSDGFNVNPEFISAPLDCGPGSCVAYSSGGLAWSPPQVAELAGILAHEVTHVCQDTSDDSIPEKVAEDPAYEAGIEILCKAVDHGSMETPDIDLLCEKIRQYNEIRCAFELAPVACAACPDASPPCGGGSNLVSSGPTLESELLNADLSKYRGTVTLDRTQETLKVRVRYLKQRTLADVEVDLTAVAGSGFQAISFAQISPDFIAVAGVDPSTGQGTVLRVDLTVEPLAVDSVSVHYTGTDFLFPASIRRLPGSTDLMIWDSYAAEMIVYSPRFNRFSVLADAQSYPELAGKSFMYIFGSKTSPLAFTAVVTSGYHYEPSRAYRETGAAFLLDQDGDFIIDN